MEIDTTNKFMVGRKGEDVVLLNPPRGPISQDDAIMLAAWLVALSTDSSIEFGDALDAVSST